MDTNNFFLDEDCDFHSVTKLGPTIENNFSYLLVICNMRLWKEKLYKLSL